MVKKRRRYTREFKLEAVKLAALDMALARESGGGGLHHSDRGVQ